MRQAPTGSRRYRHRRLTAPAETHRHPAEAEDQPARLPRQPGHGRKGGIRLRFGDLFGELFTSGLLANAHQPVGGAGDGHAQHFAAHAQRHLRGPKVLGPFVVG